MLKVWRGDVWCSKCRCRPAENVGTGGLPHRAFDAAGELVINVFRAGIAL